MKKQKFKSSNKWVLTAGVILAGILLFLTGLFAFLMTSDYFKVKEIMFNESNNTVDPSYLKGRCIFNLDLAKEAENITEHYPTYRKIRLIRMPPNRLFVDFVRRRPVAIVRLSRQFCIDAEGVLFDPPQEPQEGDLPYILGLETKIFDPKPGKKYNNRELILALSIIKEVRSNRLLRDYGIKKVDVTNLSSVSLFISEPQKQQAIKAQPPILPAEVFFEVKLDAQDARGKVNILSGLLSQIKNDSGNIKYIDLRFREPVVKFNEAKAYGTKRT